MDRHAVSHVQMVNGAQVVKKHVPVKMVPNVIRLMAIALALRVGKVTNVQKNVLMALTAMVVKKVVAAQIKESAIISVGRANAHPDLKDPYAMINVQRECSAKNACRRVLVKTVERATTLQENAFVLPDGWVTCVQIHVQQDILAITVLRRASALMALRVII